MKRGANCSKARAWPAVVRPARRTKLRMARGCVTPAGTLLASSLGESGSVTRPIVGVAPGCDPASECFGHGCMRRHETQRLRSGVECAQRVAGVQRPCAVLLGQLLAVRTEHERRV